MATIEKFEDLLIWQKGKELSLGVYRALGNTKDQRFKSQIQSAAVSIMNNIAEGFERKGNKEFARFLYIAKGSVGEVRSMLYLGFELGYLSQKEFGRMHALSTDIIKMIAGLLRTL